MIAYHLKREDEGKYICIAENNAGRIEAEAELVSLLNLKAETADEIYNYKLRTCSINIFKLPAL